METAWLHVVGIGEDGMEGLLPATRAVVESAEFIIGGDRHPALKGAGEAERLAWPEAFDDLIALLRSLRGRRVVVLAAGDPLWFSIGARIGRVLDPADITYHPQVSAFQLAAARMGWSLPDVETLTVHGRPVEQMIAFIQPEARLIILATGAGTPGRIARFLTERGFGASRMTVLAAMGGAQEMRFDGMAETWDHVVPAFNTLAVDCVAAPDAALLPRVPGLSDELFEHDGTVTPSEVRAVTLARLMPMRGAVLWDSGTGCGSVAVEWMRGARYARAIGYYRAADLDKALPLIDSLLAEYPRDPYFWELKGQMFFENGDAEGALAPYQNAVSLLPHSALIKRDLARVQLALNDPSLLTDAVANLLEALAENRETPFTWRQLAIAYGRQGDKGHSSLALAEEALLTGRLSVARYHGGLAERVFPEGSREWLQAQDIITAARPRRK